MQMLAQSNRGRETSSPAPVESWPPYPYLETTAVDAGKRTEQEAAIHYWQVIRRRKLILLAMICAGGLAGLLFTRPQTPVYQAKASIEVLPVNENFLNMREVNPTASEPTYASESDVQTQVNLLQSDATLDGAVARMNLDRRALPPEINVSAFQRVLGAKAMSKRERALALAATNLRVRGKLNTRLIEIRYDSADPAYAADFVNALAAETIERNLQSRWQSAQHTSDWLTRQMVDQKRKLEQSEDRVQTYLRSTGLALMGDKDNLAEHGLQQVQDELSRAQADRISKQSRYELAASASIEALPEVLDDAGLKDYQSKLTDLQRQLAELSSSFTAAHPKIKKVEAELSELRAARDAARNNIVARIRNEFEAARHRERLLTAAYEKQLQFVSSQAAAVSRYSILKGEADADRQLYESMLQRVKEAGLASALRANNIQIVEAAQPPRQPYKPNLALNTGLGLLSGVFLGIGLIVVRTNSDRRIREPGDAAGYLKTSELGVIPCVKSDPYVEAKSLQRGLSLKAQLQENALVPNHPEVKFWRRERSALAESFHSVLTSLLFAGDNGQRPRVIVLSSPNPGEGKTLVTSNLAIALARANMRVLVIDGDLRRPRVHDIFGINNGDGLSDVLLRADMEIPQGSLNETSLPGLAVLSSGSSSDVDLLYSKRLPGLIAKLRREFDMILIDTPPMLHMPDARVLARHADAVVLVVRARHTTKDAALLARQRFAEDGTPVLGTILNDWDPAHSSAYGYENYYDHYRHKRKA